MKRHGTDENTRYLLLSHVMQNQVLSMSRRRLYEKHLSLSEKEKCIMLRRSLDNVL